MHKILRWLGFKPEIVYLEPEPPGPEGADADDSIAQLAHHPGFIALMRRLTRQRAQLESSLRSRYHANIDEVRALQAGVYWCGWLEAQLRRKVYKTEPVTREALDAELAAFEEIKSSLTEVGI